MKDWQSKHEKWLKRQNFWIDFLIIGGAIFLIAACIIAALTKSSNDLWLYFASTGFLSLILAEFILHSVRTSKPN